VKVALIQMDLALGRPEVNRDRAAKLVREAAAGADLVMLPEMWTTGYALPELAGKLADRDGEPTGPLLAGLARECGIYLAGSAADERAGRVYNLATVYGPDGRRLAEYSKVHLVPMMNEPQYLAPGERAVVADLGGVKAGLAICYDLRFPELHRAMALGGAQLLLIPAEWPAQRLHHWRTLVMARAIENQCFVLACNRCGRDEANAFPGHSLVVDPWGNILAEGGEGEEIVRAEIDIAQVAEIRAKVPVFRDRRPEAYRLGE
jgi:predicted amidohydrolase